jgi:hypothetical protein
MSAAASLVGVRMKQTGKRSAGKPHAAFDVAGAGTVTMVAGLRSTTKVMELHRHLPCARLLSTLPMSENRKPSHAKPD